MTRSEKWLRLIRTLQIRTSAQELIRLHYNTPQRMVWNRARHKIDRKEPIRYIILKARREGISTEVESWLLALVATTDLANALVTAHLAKPALDIWNMSKLFVETSPILRHLASIGNSTITIGRSVLKISTAGSPESERGTDLTAWHASEASRYKHPEVMTATMQSLPRSPHTFSIGVVESTANGRSGIGELFYHEWNRAVRKKSGWEPIFLSWHIFPSYRFEGATVENLDIEEVALVKRFKLTMGQLAWRRWCIATSCKGNVDIFRQEYPSTPEEAFIQSGLPFFRPEHLLPLEEFLRDGKLGMVDVQGNFQGHPEGWLQVWRMPQPGHQYVVGADSSMGIEDNVDGKKEHSRSAACVLDMDTLEQVAEYDAVSAPHIFARHLCGIGRMYNNALMAPEVQASGGGGGREIIVYLREMEYWNLHRWRRPDSIKRHGGVLYGWETNSHTRPRMLARIREVVMEQSSAIHSRALFDQLSSFGEDDHGNEIALAGHDDLLFAYGIALMSRSENYYKMVAPPAGSQRPEPDWASMGINFQKHEDPWLRLQRKIALTVNGAAPEKRSFLEY